MHLNVSIRGADRTIAIDKIVQRTVTVPGSVLQTGSGDDTIQGLGGADTIIAGAGRVSLQDQEASSGDMTWA